LRLGVVGAYLVTILIIIAGVLLVPTYIFLVEASRAKGIHLANLEAALTSGDETALSNRLAVLASDAASLASLAAMPTASATIRSALAAPHSGVALSGFVYTPANGKNNGTLAITGTASTRDALRTYQLALEGAPLSRSVDLPIAAYAKDTNSVFTVTVTLAL
jgi:hypothetical protein